MERHRVPLGRQSQGLLLESNGKKKAKEFPNKCFGFGKLMKLDTLEVLVGCQGNTQNSKCEVPFIYSELLAQ